MWTRLWVRIVSVLVPGPDREEWIEEWDGELAARSGRSSDAWGALPDAWTLRTQGWTMDGMLREVRAAVKGLARKPFFTALAGITLAIGIGANTAIFSVVDAVLINPLPYPDSGKLLSVNHTAPGLNLPVVPHSEAMYLHYLNGFKTLSSFAIFQQDNVNLEREGDPERISASVVTQEFFDVMGVHPVLGRDFVTGEDRKGAEPVAVLGHGLWERSFGGDRSVIGRTVDMDGVQRRVVGVMPEGFSFPGKTELWIPMAIDQANPSVGSLSYLGIGRLASGQTEEATQAEMRGLLYSFADAHPDDLNRQIIEQAGLAPDVKPLKALYTADLQRALWILLGTVGFVLLIACANVANLFLVRAEERQREQALRTALGASRRDMVRHYLTESVTLALGGGALGLILAWAGVRGLLALAPIDMPRASEIGIDGSVLAFTAVVSVVSGLVFGLFPVFGYARKDLSGALKEGGRASTGGRERHRARSTLVVAQVALALILLVGSGLMARSFSAMRNVDLGFATADRLSFHVSLPAAEYPDAHSVGAFERGLQQRLEAIPGVETAALATALPLEDQKNASPLEAADHPVPEGQLGTLVNLRRVSPRYFESMGITLLDGRGLTSDDEAPGVRSVVISQALARSFWPNDASVLGRQLREQGDTLAFEVVGVTRDVRFEKVAEIPEPMAYYAIAPTGDSVPSPARSLAVVMKVGADPMSFVSAAREALRAVDPRLPMVEPRTVATIVRDAMAPTSFTVVLLGIAAGIALLLGTVGIYGVVSYMVSRRTQEIGVRMALGAPGGVVLREVVGQGMTLTGVGLVVGLLGAWGVSRVLASLLYGVSATDPMTYAVTACGLGLVALLASWIPARRAAQVDPVEALRSE
ncbi:MAG: ABC transporter permease [Gemmatimonadetes bacterium]|nr:ABC transporter permease [Gemmatimonadota bacterium]